MSKDAMDGERCADVLKGTHFQTCRGGVVGRPEISDVVCRDGDDRLAQVVARLGRLARRV